MTTPGPAWTRSPTWTCGCRPPPVSAAGERGACGVTAAAGAGVAAEPAADSRDDAGADGWAGDDATVREPAVGPDADADDGGSARSAFSPRSLRVGRPSAAACPALSDPEAPASRSPRVLSFSLS